MSDGAADKEFSASTPDPIQVAAEEPLVELAPETAETELPLEAVATDLNVGHENGNNSPVAFQLIAPQTFANGFPYLVPERPAPRTPNFADACLFLVMLTLGLLVTTGLVGLALYMHWFGLKNFDEASKSTPVALGTQLLLYLIALAGAVPFFRTVWGKGYFAGLHWNGTTAIRLRFRLIATAFLCNVLAIVGNWLLPFPQHAPIDKLFGSSRDAWMLATFGVTIAPFFEEMIFRGFLLPAVATAWDWISERFTGRRPQALDSQGNPRWSPGAMIFGALVVSAPFALMHSAQVGQAWGPLMLLYCVSLILCAVRLATRSLAASTLVHSAYNCMLFTVMLLETSGFRHMDKL